MRRGSRTTEFFENGAVVAGQSGSTLSRVVAGLGLAAMMSFTNSEASAAERLRCLGPEMTESALPDMNPVIFDHEAEKILNDHVAEMIENMTVHQYGDYRVPHMIAKAIVRAAKDTGFPADYLMAIAEKESSFDGDARPGKGSAEGYFQYIDQSWLSVIKRYGAEFGLGDAADLIVQKRNRRGSVYWDIEDESLREEILGLRRDPYLSAVMTASDLKEARAAIEAKLDVIMQDEDLYIPHFLGSDNAEDLIAAAESRPTTSAKKLFPKAARYNHAMFHDKRGHALSVTEFRERAQGVIASRAKKYSDVTTEIEQASFITDTAIEPDNDNTVTAGSGPVIQKFRTQGSGRAQVELAAVAYFGR